MNIVEIYARVSNGTIAHIFTPTSRGGIEPDTLQVARFDTSANPEYEDIYNIISGRVKNIRFQNGNLIELRPIGEPVLVADAAWILARKTEVEAMEAEKVSDNDARTHILQQADNALTQIANDLTAITNGKAAATAATTLAQFRTIILGMLDVQEHICNRQEGEIKVLRAMLRSGLTDT